MYTRTIRRYAAMPVTAAALVLALACGGGGDGSPAPTATLPPPTLRVTNETECVLHVYFDNQAQTALGRVQPGATQSFTDPRLHDWSFMSIESTMAIFRKYDLRDVREDGWDVTVRPAIGDNPCIEE